MNRRVWSPRWPEPPPGLHGRRYTTSTDVTPLIFVARGRISPVYLLDAAAEVALVSAWQLPRLPFLTRRSFVAGPWTSVPSAAKREPWQGHSQARSAVFQPTMLRKGPLGHRQPGSTCVPAPRSRSLSPSAGTGRGPYELRSAICRSGSCAPCGAPSPSRGTRQVKFRSVVSSRRRWARLSASQSR